MRLWISLLILLIVPFSITHAQSPTADPQLFYTFPDNTDPTRAYLCLLAVSALDEEQCLNLPAFHSYAFSPDYSFLAVRTVENGQTLVLNLDTQEQFSLPFCQPLQEFLWDAHSQQSGTLTWSPDSQFLAFTGVETTDSCTVHQLGGIYLYDTQSQETRLLTEDIAHDGAFVTPASWSPDGEWLMLYGAWSENPTASEQRFRSAIIARDGSQFREVAPQHPTCRLQWSPDMQWLASNTDCVSPIGTGSRFIAIPFDFAPIEIENSDQPLYLDYIVHPLQFGQHPINGWQTSYSPPIWLESDILASYREITSVSPLNAHLPVETQARYHSSGLAFIGLTTLSEMILLDLTGTQTRQHQNFLIITDEEGLTVMNIRNNQQRVLALDYAPCLPNDVIQISEQVDFIATLNNCTLEPLSATITIHSPSGILWEKHHETNAIRLLGFSG